LGVAHELRRAFCIVEGSDRMANTPQEVLTLTLKL
jgi:hypothetical protein